MKEKAPLVAETPTDAPDLQRELRQYAEQLDAVRHLELYAAAVDAPQRTGTTKDQYYFLLELNTSQRQIRITSYNFDQLTKANTDYLNAERQILKGGQRDAVLVAVSSFAALKRAYPNYFLDTHRFIQLVNEVCGQQSTAAANAGVST
jgi:hypothetical protein